MKSPRFRLAAPVAAAAILLAASAGAQRPALRVYSIEDGLKFPQSFSVFQARTGFIWVGTSYGVARFDGRSFATLTTADGLPHDSVRAVAEDGTGAVWVLTDNGPARIDPADGASGLPRLMPTSPDAGPPYDAGLLDLAGGDDALWFLHRSGVFRLRDGALKAWKPAGGEAAHSFGPVGGDEAWLCGRSRIGVVRTGEEPRWFDAPATGGRIVAAARLGGDLLVVQDHGVARLAGDRLEPDPRWRLPDGLDPRGVVSMGDRLVVLTGDHGAVIMRPEGPSRALSLHEGMPSASVADGLVDRDGVLWLATDDGLVKVFDLSIRSWPTRRPAIGGMVLTFARDAGGALWAGHSEGVVRLGPDGAVDLGSAREVPGGVWALLPLPSGGLLAGTRDGLAFLDRNGLRRLDALPLAGRTMVFGIARDHDGRIWATTLRGVAGFDWDNSRGQPRGAEVVLAGAGPSSPAVEGRAAAVGAEGVVWFGSDGSGVLRWDGREVRRFGREHGLPSGVCRSVLPRPEGVWVGTDRGLWLLTGEKAREVEEVNRQLSDRYIVSMAASADSVWVATSYEVLRVRDGKIVGRVDRLRGLVGGSTTAENCLLAEPGGVWIGMTGGLSHATNEALSRVLPAPAVTIVAAADGEGNPLAADTRLPFPVRSVSFEFRSPTFLAEEATRFSWRLVGHDDRWSPPDARAGARFTNLLPGSYTFEVEAVGAAGLRSAQPARMRFAVIVPWAMASAAVAAALTLVVGIAWLLASVHTRRILRRNVELERQVAERTSQLAEANRRLERLANEDGLTGIANYRVFQDQLQREWGRGLREGKPLSLVMIDIDAFKAYNDALGHQRGDECLRQVASAIAEQAARPGDLAARYGGEEFVVLLPGTDESGAFAVADRLRAAVEGLGIRHPASPTGPLVTISAGVATRRPSHGHIAEELMAAADRALYRAKREGRNRVVAAVLP
ncbi:MAG: diguanylate cyclase [Acidobacteriota bacterium]